MSFGKCVSSLCLAFPCYARTHTRRTVVPKVQKRHFAKRATRSLTRSLRSAAPLTRSLRHAPPCSATLRHAPPRSAMLRHTPPSSASLRSLGRLLRSLGRSLRSLGRSLRSLVRSLVGKWRRTNKVASVSDEFNWLKWHFWQIGPTARRHFMRPLVRL